ncbi:ABC transporter ATP-binding protein [Bosea sp. 2KB_26]|uniref:ABC transporter ATP-binding protein n=1 Tax=Bosea sp. 2KB_26 TaxID=3237475 RepID=UPI003F91FEB2
MNASAPLLEVQDLKKHFALSSGMFGQQPVVRAVDGVDFGIEHGQTLGLVGESGCGKSTVSRVLMRLTNPTAGRILIDGSDIAEASGSNLHALRRRVQMVFQDPYASLNPRMRAADIVREPLDNYGIGARAERRERVEDLFSRVGLRKDQLEKYPHEFSGGQRQRIGIARALALEPQLIILDEPVSALDVSVQAQVINLLVDLQDDLGVSFLFVAHDLAVVEHISHRVAVMYLGKIVEIGERSRIFEAPLHPYTRALLASVPEPDPERRTEPQILSGEMPSPINPPSGCAFRTRCPLAERACAEVTPTLRAVAHDHAVACIKVTG